MIIDTLRKACEVFGMEYREGVTRLLDLAKVVGANYNDGYTLEQILEQVDIPENPLIVKSIKEESKKGELDIKMEEIKFVDITKLKNNKDHLINIRKALKDYKWFLAFGTALGLYRDKDFIPEDTDIDVAIIASNKPNITKLEKAFKDYKVVRTVKDDEKIYQICFQSKDKMIIDICFFYEIDEFYYTRAGGGQFIDLQEVIGETKKKKTKYGIFPFPEKIEEYLEGRYTDWKTPKHGAVGSSKKVCE